MNCQACRQQLQPFLDDELAVNENVVVLEHVTACGPCQQVFNAEKRMLESLRARLSKETCPPALADRLFAKVRADAAPRAWPRSLTFALPAAAAVIAAVLFWQHEPRHEAHPPAPPPGVRATWAAERLHDLSEHGELLAWAGARYDELVAAVPPKHVLTSAVLRKTEPRSRALSDPDEFVNVVRAELGREFRLPAAFLEGGRVVGGELLHWHEGRVQQVVVEFGDRELALFEISGCQAKKLNCEFTALLASLRSVESDPVRQVSIAACRACDCVLVLRKNRTYLLLSRHGRDWKDEWLLERARKLVE